jgi:phosphohistidine swiveling domain-containing protein
MSREFKLPGIVGIDGVVDLIKTGDTVEVDARGVKGIIRIIN